MENNELPKATEKEFVKRTKLTELLQKDHSDEINMEYLDLMNSYRWFPELFEENGKVGIKDILGKTIIPPEFDNISFFPSMIERQEVAAAQKNGLWGLVATNGSSRQVSNFEFDWIAPIAGPLVIVKKNGKWGYLEHSGVPFREIEYDDIQVDRNGYTFLNGYSVFTKNSLWGITDGNRITNAEYDEIDHMELDSWVRVKKNSVPGFIDQNGNFTTDEDEAYWYCDFPS